MKRFSIVLVSLIVVFCVVGIASAAPTSTIVRNLYITGLSDGSSPCLIIDSNGLVATSSCAGSQAISTSSAITVNEFPYWTSTTGKLAGTSTLTYSSGNLNVSGTISVSGTLVLTTSTGLTVNNFATTAISQWSNDSGFITTSTGLTVSNFSSANISQWTNDTGYTTTTFNAGLTGTSSLLWGGNINASGTISVGGTLVLTTTTGLTVSNFTSANISQWTNDAAYVTSTGANPTVTVGASATNGTANTFMRSDAAPALASQYVSSTLTATNFDATTTGQYAYFLMIAPDFDVTLSDLGCMNVAGTSTYRFIRATTSVATSGQAVASSTCGTAGTTVASGSFTTTTISAGTFLVAITSSTAGTPTRDSIYFHYTK